jgi:hypothetical protein
MYRIPLDLDLSRLVGSEINQICLGRHDVQFKFSGLCHISTQITVIVKHEDDLISSWNENWSTADFQMLLNRKIEGYSIPDDRSLVIVFCGGYTLMLRDDSDQYESMQIWLGGPGLIII